MNTPAVWPTKNLDRVLIPFNGDPASNILLRYALAMSDTTRQVNLLPVTRDQGSTAREAATCLRSLLAEQAHLRPTVRIAALAPAENEAASILETAHELHANFIIMAMHDQEHTRYCDSEATTVSEEVALTARIPVMVLRPEMMRRADAPDRTTRILIPLDGSAASRQALPVAATLARQRDVAVHLLTVLDPVSALPPAYAYLSSIDPDRQDAVAGLQREANEALNRAETALRRADVGVTSELVYGLTERCLISAIQHGDVVVMTTHGKGNASRSRFGSMALCTVRESSAPVVIVHPPVTNVADGRFRGLWESAASFTPHAQANEQRATQ